MNLSAKMPAQMDSSLPASMPSTMKSEAPALGGGSDDAPVTEIVRDSAAPSVEWQSINDNRPGWEAVDAKTSSGWEATTRKDEDDEGALPQRDPDNDGDLN